MIRRGANAFVPILTYLITGLAPAIEYLLEWIADEHGDRQVIIPRTRRGYSLGSIDVSLV